MPAGYSNTPLVKKLGLKPGARACFLHAPPHLFDLLGPLPEGVHLAETPETGLDYLHFFAMDRPHLGAAFSDLKQHLAFDGMLWISWPKKTSSIATDLSGNIVREIGLGSGLVDVKVCAVDADWSDRAGNS